MEVTPTTAENPCVTLRKSSKISPRTSFAFTDGYARRESARLPVRSVPPRCGGAALAARRSSPASHPEGVRRSAGPRSEQRTSGRERTAPGGSVERQLRRRRSAEPQHFHSEKDPGGQRLRREVHRNRAQAR